METEVDIQALKAQTSRNVFFLTLRNFGIQLVSVVGFFILTLLLGTGEVGLFAIVAESVAVLGYFSDVGLASALIQQKGDITRSELRTTFTIQQLLVVLALLVVSQIYPPIAEQKGYGAKEFWILVSLCFSFAAASLKTIPSVLLERKLDFKLISTIDILENVSFYLFAVIFALMGHGAFSYAYATFIRSSLGLITIYIISPWPIGFSFSKESAKKLFKFGIPFQLNSFIAMAKDRLSNLLVAGIIGRDSFGLLAWAQKGPRLPLGFMDAIMKVTFPTFSRIQDNQKVLATSIEKSLYFIAFFVFPMLTGISLIAPDIINIIPKYQKWSPAITPLYFYAISYAIAAITTPLTNAYNAVGKILTTTKFMVMWTLLTWIFFPLLSWKFDYIGTAVASLIVGASSFIVWHNASKTFKIDIISQISTPLFSSAIMALSITLVSLISLSPIISLSLKIIVGGATYLVASFLLSKNEIIWFISQLSWLKAKK